MKNRTLRVAIGSTLWEEKQIENGVIQGTVVRLTLFLVAMADITHGIEDTIKIIHTTHKHERVSVVKLQKSMDKIVRWADNTGHQIEKQLKNKSHHVQPQKHCNSLQTKTGSKE
jgi:hypothetical protein